MKRLITGLIVLIALNISSKGQSGNANLEEPEVGKQCPAFVFKKVDFYKKDKVTLEDFKGKWLILDFWAKNCSSCIESFPKISTKQKEFQDSVQFLMVTYEDKEKQHRLLYAAYHDRMHLLMPCAFDSAIFRTFNVGTLPHTIIIDPTGIVRAITIGVNSSKLHELLEGKDPMFVQATYADHKEKMSKFKFDNRHPFLVDGNGGIDSNFMFRSLLTAWSPSNPIFINNTIVPSEYENNFYNNKGRFEALHATLSNLYLAAYTGIPIPYNFKDDSTLYGNFWPNPILEMRDTSLFVPDIVTGNNLYCYSLIVPSAKASKEYMEELMQSDLKHYFGYKVSIERREMPYWKLIVIDRGKAGKLRSKGGPEFFTNHGKAYQGFTIKNYSMQWFIAAVTSWSGVTNDGSPLLDETGIKDNIDITAEWLRNDLDSIRKSLQKNGLDLVKGTKNMKVLLIKDSE